GLVKFQKQDGGRVQTASRHLLRQPLDQGVALIVGQIGIPIKEGHQPFTPVGSACGVVSGRLVRAGSEAASNAGATCARAASTEARSPGSPSGAKRSRTPRNASRCDGRSSGVTTRPFRSGKILRASFQVTA